MDTISPNYVFLQSKRHLTRGISNEVPVEIQVLMWDCIDDLVKSDTSTDYLQVFDISVTVKGTLKVKHHQENPSFERELELKSNDKYYLLDKKRIFVIDDITHSTMLFASEY